MYGESAERWARTGYRPLRPAPGTQAARGHPKLLAHEVARTLPNRDGADELQRAPVDVVTHAGEAGRRIERAHAQQARVARLELLGLKPLDRPGDRMSAQLIRGIEAEDRDVNVLDAREELTGDERALDSERNAVDTIQAADVEQVTAGGRRRTSRKTNLSRAPSPRARDYSAYAGNGDARRRTRADYA